MTGGPATRIDPIGRDAELDLLRSLASGASGRALVLLGQPGVGKTLLLDWATDHARAAGRPVLRACGTQFEQAVAYASLDQLLRPLRAQLDDLPRPQRDALAAAFGFARVPAPRRPVVADAVLGLISSAGGRDGLLLVVDDLQWVDAPSAAVLGALASRLGDTPAVLLGASRGDSSGYFDVASAQTHAVEPLDEASSNELVLRRHPRLEPDARARVVARSGGIPLALVELHGVTDAGTRHPPDAHRPTLTRRLQELFASRAERLPATTRRLLLLFALGGAGDVVFPRGPLEAGGGFYELTPAIQAGLIIVTGDGVRFAHPLAGSAVVESATDEDRRSAHDILADALPDDPCRRAFHLANARVAPDEGVAAILEDAAYLFLERGESVEAVTTLLRSAELSPRHADRIQRLAKAAYLGADVTGELLKASDLLARAEREGAGASASLSAAVAAAFLLLNGEGDVDTAHRLVAGALDAADALDPTDRLVTEALHTLLTICWFGGGRRELWAPFEEAMRRLGPEPPEVLGLCATLFADPVRADPGDLRRLDARIAQLHGERDPTAVVRTGMAAFFVDRLPGCREAHWRVVGDGRRGGAVASGIDALIHLCLDDLLAGQWDEALELAAECREVCSAHGYEILSWPVRYATALIAAARGAGEEALTESDAMTRWAAPRGARAVQMYGAHVRAVVALTRSDFHQAVGLLAQVSPPGVLPRYVPLALWCALDLVDAAVRGQRRADAAAHVVAMEEAGLPALSPRLRLVTDGAAAMVTVGAAALPAFERALGHGEADRFPFEQARIRLAFGERLRRARRVIDSRTQLKLALAAFERLGAAPWAERARGEIRATGEGAAPRQSGAPASLTPQEFEIATLAAAGFTNRQIADQLFLSPRTVGGHLYRIFPKLGISTRASLRDALTAAADGSAQETGAATDTGDGSLGVAV